MSVTVTAKCAINTKYASTSATKEYLTLSSTRTIIDKFTCYNSDASNRTLTIYIVPSGESVSSAYIVFAEAITTVTTQSIAALMGQVLNSGDKIFVKGETADKLIIRCSVRECVTS